MKPRFSILTLLAITAYVAITAGGFVNSLGNWIATGLWCISTFAMIPIATAGKTGPLVVFARGFLLGCFWLVIVAIANYGSLEYVLAVPGEYFDSRVEEAVYIGDGVRREIDASAQPVATIDLIHLFLQTVFTVIGSVSGLLAVWYYRRQERRAHQEKSGE